MGERSDSLFQLAHEERRTDSGQKTEKIQNRQTASANRPPVRRGKKTANECEAPRVRPNVGGGGDSAGVAE